MREEKYIVQGSSFNECQMKVVEIMEECSSATFTIPVQAADGSFVAYGHAKFSTEKPTHGESHG